MLSHLLLIVAPYTLNLAFILLTCPLYLSLKSPNARMRSTDFLLEHANVGLVLQDERLKSAQKVEICLCADEVQGLLEVLVRVAV